MAGRADASQRWKCGLGYGCVPWSEKRLEESAHRVLASHGNKAQGARRYLISSRLRNICSPGYSLSFQSFQTFARETQTCTADHSTRASDITKQGMCRSTGKTILPSAPAIVFAILACKKVWRWNCGWQICWDFCLNVRASANKERVMFTL